MGKRLQDIAVENTADNRSRYRRALFSTPELARYISGAILFDETARCAEARRLLTGQGILMGIKVDQGTREMALGRGELFTRGLDTLAERSAEYYALGCRFAKWRSVVKISDCDVSERSVRETAYGLARYAAICQENGLVPIVEPEILMDGGHCVGVCRLMTERVLAAVVKALTDQNVLLEGILIKCNMVLPGSDFEGKRSIEKNAELTVKALKRRLPPAIPGVTFLSGGQSEEEASLHLNEMNKTKNLPWKLSFSFGRALQRSALQAWKGKDENVDALQKALLERAKANSEATKGNYKGGAPGSKESLFQKGYVY